jgi:hypothetical protein
LRYSLKKYHSFITHIRDLQESEQHIRWCRANLGERGVDWDFEGARNLVVHIRNSPQAAFYRLKFPAHDFVR